MWMKIKIVTSYNVCFFETVIWIYPILAVPTYSICVYLFPTHVIEIVNSDITLCWSNYVAIYVIYWYH